MGRVLGAIMELIMRAQEFATMPQFNPWLPEIRIFFFDVILFRMGRKIYMIFVKIFHLKKITLRRPWAARQVN